MRKALLVACATALLALAVGPWSGAAMAGKQKLVVGTVYDTTCVTVCVPHCPPPCGPVPVPLSRNAAICAQASIVCPLYRIAPGGSVYSGEGSVVNVRKRGSTTLTARLPIVEGHFKTRLAPGEYVFHPFMAEEDCWSAEPVTAGVKAKSKSPVGVTMSATDRCIVHADAK